MNDSIIVKRMKERMKELGINARKLANQSKVGRSFVYDVLSGKSKNPTSLKLFSIAKELKVSMSYLVGESSADLDISKYSIGYPLLENQQNTPCLLLSKAHFRNLSANYNIKIFTVPDDAMAPALCKDDVLIIDDSEKIGSVSGIFALKYKRSFIIRRLEYIYGSNNHVKVVAENNMYLSYEDDINNINIMGQVKYFFRSC